VPGRIGFPGIVETERPALGVQWQVGVGVDSQEAGNSPADLFIGRRRPQPQEIQRRGALRIAWRRNQRAKALLAADVLVDTFSKGSKAGAVDHLC
jgi:hypothetical protein